MGSDRRATWAAPIEHRQLPLEGLDRVTSSIAGLAALHHRASKQGNPHAHEENQDEKRAETHERSFHPRATPANPVTTPTNGPR